MKLSELMSHTADSLGVSLSRIEQVAKSLRPMRFLTSKGRGPGGAEMSARDCATLFISVCGAGVSNAVALEFPLWLKNAPGLIEYIERHVESGTAESTSLEFDVDLYCARKIGESRTQTFGTRPDTPSFVTRTVTAKAFAKWLAGLQ